MTAEQIILAQSVVIAELVAQRDQARAEVARLSAEQKANDSTIKKSST